MEEYLGYDATVTIEVIWVVGRGRMLTANDYEGLTVDLQDWYQGQGQIVAEVSPPHRKGSTYAPLSATRPSRQ